MSGTGKCIMYVGTYTSGGSEGIYTYELDAGTGSLRPAGNPVRLANPSYLAVDRDGRHLYSIMETDEFNGIPGGGVAAFSIDKGTGMLRFINCQSVKGRSACHLSIDNSAKCLFAANYGEGKLTVLPIRADGGVEAASCVMEHRGSGPNQERQEGPHVHYTTITPDEKYLCAVDLGTDQVVIYSYDQSDGRLSMHSSINVKPGFGPRHMDFSPDGRFAYLLNELDSSAVVLKYEKDGSFNILQYVSTLPCGEAGTNYPSAVHVSPDGKFLYASNRGYDSIAAFSIDPSSGLLELVSNTPTGGSFPRDFGIDPSGNYLFAANQNSENIIPFKINKETGRLARLDYNLSVPSPVCIKLVVL